MGVELLRKYISSSMIICYRSVVKHPILFGMVFLLISMYRLFPSLFSFLVYASPVIVSTAVLLGTLLSFGQPNIPEIEKEAKSERYEIQNSESKIMSHTEIVGRDGNSDSKVGDKSFGEKTSVNDDNSCVEVNRSVGLVDDSMFMTVGKSEKIQFGEEHVIEEAKSELGNPGTNVDEEKVVLGSHYSQLRQSEDENTVLESDDKLLEGSADPLHSDSGLLWKRVEGDNYEDDEGSDSGSDLAESSSPDASMADIIPMLDELHPLLAEEPETRRTAHVSHGGTDAASEESPESSDSSSESNDDNGIEHHEDLEVGDDEDKELKHTDKEDETRSAITWTEDDQKNLMNLGTSELERNRRLENLIARRRARKNMRMQAEKNLIDLESADLPWNIPPISTARNNPFDISYDSNDNIPGSAPSVLLPRRNPFDLPYDSSEEKPDLVGDTFQQEFAAVQPKEPFFRRHESFNVGPSIFGASRHERQETKLRPFFVPEGVGLEGTSFSSFQRQLSELSDSKVSSVPDTESICSADDLETNDHNEDNLSREPELISEKDQEHPSEMRDLELISKGKHVPEAREHASELFSRGSRSSEDDGNVESGQAMKRDDGLDEAEISLGNVTNQQEAELGFPETENVASSAELMADPIHLSLGDQESHSSASSLSSSYEVSDQIYNEKEGDEMPTSVSETAYYFVDRGNSIEKSEIDMTSLVVEESQPKEPVYDSSPRAVTKNLSSSSISTDLQADISERGQSPSIPERTSSFSARESQETVEKTETDCPGNDAEFVDSSEQDAAEDVGSRSCMDHNLNELELNLGSSMGDDHPHKDKSFQHTEDQHQSSSSVADDKGISTDSSTETRDVEDQLSGIPDNKGRLLAGDNISPSLQNRSMDKPSAEDLDELQGRELERGQVASSNSEAQFPEVVHGETYENPSPTHHQFVSEEKGISQPEKELPSLDTSTDKSSKENPEVLQVQITSNSSDNFQIQELENNVQVNINSALSAEPDVVEVAGTETEAPGDPANVSDIRRIENNDMPDVDEIKEIDENLLVELDAVGDFSVRDLGSTLNEMEQDPNASEHDLETNRCGDKDSYSKDLGSTLNEIKQDPNASENDLEINHSGDEDYHFKDLESTLNEMKQNPQSSEHVLETNRSGDEDSYSKDLGSSLNEMKEDPLSLEHDLESNHSGDEDSYSTDLGSTLNETKQDPHALEHDLETNPSGDEDSCSKDLGSTLNEMKEYPKAAENDLETNRSGHEDSYSKDLGSTLNGMKKDPHASGHDLETDSKDLGKSNLNEMKQDQNASENDLETNRSGDEDSYSRDLGSSLNEMKQDPRSSEHDHETNRSAYEDSYSKDLGSTLNEIKLDPHSLEHDLETNHSGDEDSSSKDLGSTLNEKQDPHFLEHDLETNRSGDDDSSSKDLGSTLNEMKQDLDTSELDIETNRSGDDSYSTDLCETKIKIDAEDVMKSQNEKEISNTEVEGTSVAEVSRPKLINDANEVILPQKFE